MSSSGFNSRHARQAAALQPTKQTLKQFLFRKSGGRQSREDPERVLVIDLFQHVIREIEAVHFPNAVVFPDRVEIVVVRLEEPEINVVLWHTIEVFAEEDSVL